MAKTAATLPVNASSRRCHSCWVRPGQTHDLSCTEVTTAQLRAFFGEPTLIRVPPLVTRMTPHPKAVRDFRGIALSAPVWAVIAWSLT